MPDWYLEDLRKADWVLLGNRGIKLVLLDIDNTLVKHGAFEGDGYCLEVIASVKSAGLVPVILSNARGDRGAIFARNVKLPYVGNAKKPSTKALNGFLSVYGVSSQEAVMVGDQLFTDIWAGKRAKTWNLLVKKRDGREYISIKIKRIIEKLISSQKEYDKLENISLSGNDGDMDSNRD